MTAQERPGVTWIIVSSIAILVLMYPFQLVMFWNVTWGSMEPYDVHPYGGKSPFPLRGFALTGVKVLSVIFEEPARGILKSADAHNHVGWAAEVSRVMKRFPSVSGSLPFALPERVALFNATVWGLLIVGVGTFATLVRRRAARRPTHAA